MNPFGSESMNVSLDGEVEVSKRTFGAEPKHYGVLAFLMERHGELRFSPPVDVSVKEVKNLNPKRMQRSLRRHRDAGMGTQNPSRRAGCPERRTKSRRKRAQERSAGRTEAAAVFDKTGEEETKTQRKIGDKMKEVLMMKLESCPYCHQALDMMEELETGNSRSIKTFL